MNLLEEILHKYAAAFKPSGSFPKEIISNVGQKLKSMGRMALEPYKFETKTLYRGMGADELHQMHTAGKYNPISWWSDSPSVAQGYAGTSTKTVAKADVKFPVGNKLGKRYVSGNSEYLVGSNLTPHYSYGITDTSSGSAYSISGKYLRTHTKGIEGALPENYTPQPVKHVGPVLPGKSPEEAQDLIKKLSKTSLLEEILEKQAEKRKAPNGILF